MTKFSFALALTLGLLTSSLVHSKTLVGTFAGLDDGVNVIVLDASRT